MSLQHHALVAQFLTTPWAMRPEVIGTLAQSLANDALHSSSLERVAPVARGAGGKAALPWKGSQTEPGHGIALLPLTGIIFERSGGLAAWLGGTSTRDFGQRLKAALNDNAVKQILIEVDSPGGSVYGVMELAAQVFAARQSKPVVVSVNSQAGSAAYWIASQASDVAVTPGGEVGSIGVYMAHQDISAATEKAGLKVTLISAGKHKVEGNPYEPLSIAGRAHYQARVDSIYSKFTAAVARGRGVPVQEVRSRMGQGRMVGATTALSEGMVDRVSSFDEVVQRLRGQPARQAGAGALSARERQLLLLQL